VPVPPLPAFAPAASLAFPEVSAGKSSLPHDSVANTEMGVQQAMERTYQRARRVDMGTASRCGAARVASIAFDDFLSVQND
jgi:hypothetical protein